MNSVVESITERIWDTIYFYIPRELEEFYKEIAKISPSDLLAIFEDITNKLEATPEDKRATILSRHAVGYISHLGLRFAVLATDKETREQIKSGQDELPPTNLLERFYYAVPRKPAEYRGVAMQMLAARSQDSDLKTLARIIRDDPPATCEAFAVGLSPLFRLNDWNLSAFFPEAFQAIEHQHIAASIIDLSNFVTNQRKLKQHPGYERRKELTELLGGVVRRLEKFEEDPRNFGQEVNEIQNTLKEAISLAVSLCYCMGLMGDEAAIGKLNQASELMHRRVQAEAFGSLARLGDDQGRKQLIALAKEPSARLRVIAYAKELGLDDMINPKFMSDVSTAEAKLALWLSEPRNFSVPPTKLELIDHRELYWPGYKEIQDVYLFRFHYELGPLTISNIAISGPVNFAFGADLADLPIEDIYAAFAGWHMEHPQVQEFPVEYMEAFKATAITPLQRKLRDAGHKKIKNITLGVFFGEHVLVSESSRGKLRGIAVTSSNDILWFPTSSRTRPITAVEAYSIFKGRIVLRSFNEALGNAWRNFEEHPYADEEETDDDNEDTNSFKPDSTEHDSDGNEGTNDS